MKMKMKILIIFAAGCWSDVLYGLVVRHRKEKFPIFVSNTPRFWMSFAKWKFAWKCELFFSSHWIKKKSS